MDDKKPNPDELMMQDFVGIGFEGGVKTALDEIRRIYPQLAELELDTAVLRERWSEQVAGEAELISFNRHYDGVMQVGHGWAWRWIAYAFISYMEKVGAKRFVKQQMEIMSSLKSGQRWLVVEVYYRDWWLKNIKDRPVFDEIRTRFPAIESVVNAALRKAKETDGSWHSEAINWGRVHCNVVEYVLDADNGRYLATIEKASPACPSLINFVRKHLEAAGFGDVDVQTEW